MLFGYPAAAIEDNWFHDCLVEVLQTIHTYYQEPQNNKEPIPNWPEIIPEIHREMLSRKHGLRDRLTAYQEAVTKLSPEELAKVKNALEGQNDISALLSGSRNCDRIDNLPEAIGEPAKELFTFAFKLLTDLEIRDRQYQIIFERSPVSCLPVLWMRILRCTYRTTGSFGSLLG